MPWKTKLRWIGIAAVGSTMVLGLAAYIAMRSAAFRSYLITQIEKQASEATGSHVRIQRLELYPSTLTVEIYGITARGSEPASATPLAQADQLTIRLKVVSLLRRQVDLKEIVLRHPVLYVLVRNDGTTNLPTPPKSNASTSNHPFDLGIKHVLLENGEIYYNDVKTPLNAELHDVGIEVEGGELTAAGYDGKLSYRNGRIQYGQMRPFPHSLDARFNVSPSEFTLKPSLLSVQSSALQIEGRLQNYTEPLVSASYKATLRMEDIRSILSYTTLPTGEVSLEGSLRYQRRADQSAVRGVVLEGHLSSRELAVHTADVRTFVRNVHGEFRLADGNLDVRRLDAEVLGGRLAATASVQHLDAQSHAKGHASIKGIPMRGVKAALRTLNPNQIPLDGHVDAAAEATWAGDGLKSLKASSDITVTGALFRDPRVARVPLDGVAHITYDGCSGVATLANTVMRTPQTRVEISGTAVGQKLDLSMQGHAADLRELDSLVSALQQNEAPTPENRTSLRSIGLAGTADLKLHITGSTDDPHIGGQLHGENIQGRNTQWRRIGFTLHASKSGVSVQNGELVGARQGYIHFAGTSVLSNWRPLPANPITLQVSSNDLSVNELLRLANLDYPVSGTLALDVSMSGSQLNPEGGGSLRLANAKVYGQPVQQLAIDFKGRRDTLTSSFDVSTPAGSAKGALAFSPQNRGYDLTLDAPAVKLAELEPVRDRNLGISGVVAITARGRGTLDDPQITASAQIPQLQIRGANISAIAAELNVDKRQAQLRLNSAIAQTQVEGHATVDLTGSHVARASVDTKAIPIEGLLALNAPAKTDGPRGVVELHASAQGPLDDYRRLEAQAVIPTIKADYQGLQIGNVKPIRVRYANSVVTLDPTEFAGTGTTLRLNGQLPLESGASGNLSATGAVDLQLLRFFSPDLQSSGKLLLDVQGTGGITNPAVQGQVRVENASMMSDEMPVGLQNINGVLEVRNDRVDISQLTGQAGGGQVSAHGAIVYRPSLQMNVSVDAKSIRVRYQEAIRTVLEGDLNLTGSSQAANLKGRILIDHLSFTENFDLAAFAGQMESGRESATSPGFADKIKLDVAVQTSRDLNLKSSAVSLQGQANLRIVGTAADPVITGRTVFTGGDIFLMNKRYQVSRAIIEFANPRRTEPVLNVLLTTRISQYNLSLSFRGPLEKMETSYVSDPPLPTADIVNLIARGQTTQQAAASPSSFGATSLLAQGAASQVSGGVQKLAGLSSLSIDPTLGGNNTAPGARIAMQKRVTDNFLFTFATDVTSTQRELIQGEYQFNKRWSASVTRDENGGFAVDGKYHKRY